LKSKYFDVLSEPCEEASKDPKRAGEAVTGEHLEQRKRPLKLGEEMDATVQEYIKKSRDVSCG